MSPPLVARIGDAPVDAPVDALVDALVDGPHNIAPVDVAPVDGALAYPVADTDLRDLLTRAPAADAPRLRALIHGYVAQRPAVREVLAFLAAREGGAAIATVPARLRARALVAPPRVPPAPDGPTVAPRGRRAGGGDA